MRKTLLAAAVGALTALGCAGNPPPIPVEASAAGLRLLEGKWVGTYESERQNREGSIVFTLDARADTARGDVLMVPRESGMSNGYKQRRETILPSAPEPPSVLSIRFVRMRGNEVTGTLDPYVSPDCGCVVVTIFTGFVDEDVITGTYVTEAQFARVAEGTWQVVKR